MNASSNVFVGCIVFEGVGCLLDVGRYIKTSRFKLLVEKVAAWEVLIFLITGHGQE